MIRRRFMQLFGLVPSIIIAKGGRLNGQSFTADPTRDVRHATVYLCGRAMMTGREVATKNRTDFINSLIDQLDFLRDDMIRYYDRAVAGKVPVSQNEDGQKFIGDVI